MSLLSSKPAMGPYCMVSKVTPWLMVMPLGGQPCPPPPSSRKTPALMPATAPYCSAMASSVRPKLIQGLGSGLAVPT